MEFWIGLFVLVLAALAWPFLALFRPQQPRKDRRTTLNIAIYRDRLEELKADLDNETLDESQFEAAKGELARSLLHDLGQTPTETGPAKKRKLMLWTGIAVLLIAPVAALVIYDYLEKEIYFVEVEPGNNTSDAQMAQREVRRQMFQLLSDPDNGEGWTTLGRAYMIMGRPAEALQAYERALRLQGESADLLVSKAHALARLHQGNLEGEPEHLINRALALDPDSRAALTWAGMVRFQRGDFAEAIRYWDRLLALIPEDAEPVGAIRSLIARARQQMASPSTGAEEAQADTPASNPVANGKTDSGSPASISVAVSLDSQLRATVQPDDTVFILARASEGPRMPLAIVKKQVRDLPLTVKLDDSMAMVPQMKLSTFPQVTVIARISRSGNATPQSGDLYGEQGPVSSQNTDRVNVVIGSTVP